MREQLHKVAYGAGSLATTLSYESFKFGIQNFYVSVLGMPTSLIGGIWVFYGIWNAINDPLMGRLSDRTHTRLGRRIPYILFGAVPLGIFYLLMWTPPVGLADSVTGSLVIGMLRLPMRTVILGVYLFGILFLFDTLWTLVVIAWTALFPEIWPDLRERAAVAGWREAFALIGALLGLGLSAQVIRWLGYAGMGAVFGVITAITFLISIWGSRENPLYQVQENPMPLWDSIKAAFAIPSFRWFLLINLAKEFIFVSMAPMAPFYARDVLGAENIQSVLLAVPFLLSLPMMVVWTKITQNFGTRRAWTLSALAMAPALVILLIAPTVAAAMIGAVLMAVGLPAQLMLINLMIADVIDEDEVRTGERREGFFYGMNGAIIRVAFSWQGLLLAIIPTITGYDATLGVQPLPAQWGIRFMFAGAPIMAIGIMLWALRHYPLHGTALTEMRSQLIRRE